MFAGEQNSELEKLFTQMRADRDRLREKIAAEGSKALLIAGGTVGALFIGRFVQAPCDDRAHWLRACRFDGACIRLTDICR